MLLVLLIFYCFVIYLWVFFLKALYLSPSIIFCALFIIEWLFFLHACAQMEYFLYFNRLTIFMYSITTLIYPLIYRGKVYERRKYCKVKYPKISLHFFLLFNIMISFNSTFQYYTIRTN